MDWATPHAVLARLRNRVPALRLEVSSRGSRDQHRRLLNGGLDLGLCGSTSHCPDGLAGRIIRREVLGVALPANHPLAAAQSVAVRELTDETNYLPRDGFPPEARRWSWCAPVNVLRSACCRPPIRTAWWCAPLDVGVPTYGWGLRWRKGDRTPDAALDALHQLD